MKTLLRILILQAAVGQALLAEDKADTIPSAWMKISALTQNYRYFLLEKSDSEARRDPDYVKKAQKRMDHLLEQLVEDGTLVKETIQLKSRVDIGEGMNHLTVFAEEIGQTYGQYVALELMGFGLTMAMAPSNVEAHRPLTIVARLPKEQLQQYKTFLSKNNLLASPKAEQ